MNYLLFVDRILRQSTSPKPVRFLVSGTDQRIRTAVLQDIVESCRQNRKPLFVIDDSVQPYQDDYRILESAGYLFENGLDGNSCLHNPFQVNTLKGSSQFRQLLGTFGYDEKQKAKLLSYFHFLLYLETRCGQSQKQEISVDHLAKYNTVMAVENKIQEMVDYGVINPQQQQSLLAKYSECSSAAADFEDILLQILPFIQGQNVCQKAVPGTAVYFQTGELAEDEVTRSIILQLLGAGMQNSARKNTTVLIFDCGDGNREGICRFIKRIPRDIDIHILSDDIFTICESSRRTLLLNRFTARVYSRHRAMDSCKEIETLCGEINVVHRTYTATYDRRWRANTPVDILLGNNKTEIYGSTPPVREPRYTKESIAGFPEGTGIIDFMGQTSLFSV